MHEKDEAKDTGLLREMRAFAIQEPPDVSRTARSGAALRLLEALRQAAAAYAVGDVPHRIDLAELGGAELALLDQVLGEGEVSAVVGGEVPLRVQESVFAGVWRVRQGTKNGPQRDSVEVGAIPGAVVERAEQGADRPRPESAPTAGVMNAPALLREIRQQLAGFVPGGRPHVINFTLLPMTPEDFLFLEQALGTGSLTFLSRGYGNCRISASGVRRVWRVQYFNSGDSLILDTLEIAEIPEAALAPPEDIRDSAQRLGEVLQWLRQDA